MNSRNKWVNTERIADDDYIQADNEANIEIDDEANLDDEAMEDDVLDEVDVPVNPCVICPFKSYIDGDP